MSGDSTRLPRDVIPRRYDLTIVPDLDAARFTGEVTIDLDVTQRVAEVVLHAHDLEVELEALAQSGHNLAATLTADPDAERVRITAPDLAIGSATLTLPFMIATRLDDILPAERGQPAPRRRERWQARPLVRDL